VSEKDGFNRMRQLPLQEKESMKKYTILALIGLVLVVAISAQVVKYKVNSDKCITCGYCVSSKICPVNAISMQKGKAVIDQNKCIGCTLCKVGNRANYTGCPVDAFAPNAKAEQTSPTVTPKVINGQKAQTSVKQADPAVNALVSNTMKSRNVGSVAVVAAPVTAVASTETTATSPAQTVITYIVNATKCISCRLCVTNCPSGAITIVKGKAMIDQAKCTHCGICANGNGKDFKGCPVKAIGKK
jgi:ferredoxin